MSLKTWKRKFCPVAAKDMVMESTLNIVKRDLKKWKGLKERNLKRHGVKKDRWDIITDGEHDKFTIDSSTCAICQIFCAATCDGCPLYAVRGSTRCDYPLGDEHIAPYGEFIFNDNPKPMIKWLKKVKTHVRRTLFFKRW